MAGMYCSGIHCQAPAATSPARTTAAPICWVVSWTAPAPSSGKKLLGGSSIDTGFSVQQTADGGYVLLGVSD